MPSLVERPLAFVNIVTTGANPTRDRIIEIAVIKWDGESASSWSQLINPDTRISGVVETLTQINDDMLASAPPFASLADEIGHKLAGHVFVAHNARIGYAFVKNEFRRCGIDFRAPVICTLRYSRALFPQKSTHSLDSLITRHSLDASHGHRALLYAQAIFDFWRTIDQTFPAEHLTSVQKALLARPSLPPHIDPDLVNQIPEQHGVYLFYGENDLPIYIGKANQLRQRVLSHFTSDHSNPKEMAISQQVRRIEWQVCVGEIDALITEARLIKEMQPTLNRKLRRNRDCCTWRISDLGDGQTRPELLYARDLDFGQQPELYGLFNSAKDAKAALLDIAKTEELCLAVLGIERAHPNKPCFARQLKRCRGACVGAESVSQHTQRLRDSLSELRLKTWPFDGPALLPEGEALHLIDAWCHLGTGHDKEELARLLKCGRPNFDRDTYSILVKHVHEMQPMPEIWGLGAARNAHHH